MPEEIPDKELSQKEVESQVKDIGAIISNAMIQISSNLSDIIEDSLGSTKSFTQTINKQILKDIKSFSKLGDQIVTNNYKINKGLMSSKDITKQLEKNAIKKLELEQKIETAKLSGIPLSKAALKDQQQAINYLKIVNDELKKQKGNLKEVENSMGLSGKLLKASEKTLQKLGVDTGDLNKAIQKRLEAKRKELALEGKSLSKMDGLLAVTGEVGKSLLKAWKDPLVWAKLLLDAGMQFDKQATELQKRMGLSATEAYGLRAELGRAASESGNMAINSERMLKAFGTLQKELGITARFSNEMTEEAAVLQELWGLSEKAIGNFAKASIVTGKSMKQQKLEVIGVTEQLKAQSGLHISHKDMMEKVGNVSGTVRAQMGGSVKHIAEAVGEAMKLGTTLEGVAKIGESLLDFESSISSELEAELLTGKQLNLEKARMYALTGDYKNLAKEISSEVGSWSDYTKMNVLQQQALAKSMGMSKDEMADMLMQQEMQNKTAQQARAEGNEDLAKRIEARNVEEQMADAVMKLKSVFVDLVGGPVGAFLNILTLALEPINYIFTSISSLIGLFTGGSEELTVWQTIIGSIGIALMAIKGTMLIMKGIQVAGNVLAGIKFAWNARHIGQKQMENMLDKKGIGGGIAKAAGGIFRTFAQIPLGLGIPLAIGAIAGMTALVYGLSNRKAATGGAIEGPSHSQGGTNLNAEGGEFMINKSAVNSLPAGVLNTINSTGQVPTSGGGGGPDLDGFASRMENIMANSKPGAVVMSPFEASSPLYEDRKNTFHTKFNDA